MNPRRGVLLLALLLLGAIGPASAATPTRITIAHWGHEKILVYLPLYVAIDTGLFEKYGLIVSLKYSGNDDQVFASVISGQADFGIGDPAFTAISREKGGPGKVIATVLSGFVNWGLVRPDSQIGEIDNVADLDGLVVTSFPSPSTTFTILTEIKHSHDLRGMKIRQLAFGTELAALARGEADVAIMIEPQASIAESQGYREVWSVAEYIGALTLTGITASDDTLTGRPEIALRLVAGLQDALELMASSPERSYQVALANFPSLQEPVVQAAINRMNRDAVFPSDARIQAEAWRNLLALRHRVGDLLDVDAGFDAIDNSYAIEVLNPDTRARLVEPTPERTRGASEIAPSPGWWDVETVHFLGSVFSILTPVLAFVFYLQWLHEVRRPPLPALLRQFAAELLSLFDDQAESVLPVLDVIHRMKTRLNLQANDIRAHLDQLRARGFVSVRTRHGADLLALKKLTYSRDFRLRRALG